LADIINKHGDRFIATTEGHGADISSQRQDDLDVKSVALVQKRVAEGHRVTAVDLGGGLGAHSIRLAAAGAYVTMVDIEDLASPHFLQATSQGIVKQDHLKMIVKDFTQLSNSEIPDNIDLFYSQRAIHYAPYDQAKNLLTKIFNKMSSGATAFVSAAGYDTEYGLTFSDRHQSVEKRFNFVAPDMQKKHGITHRIVTYKKEELEKLLSDVGFSQVEVTQSAFGNIKATAIKP